MRSGSPRLSRRICGSAKGARTICLADCSSPFLGEAYTDRLCGAFLQTQPIPRHCLLRRHSIFIKRLALTHRQIPYWEFHGRERKKSWVCLLLHKYKNLFVPLLFWSLLCIYGTIAIALAIASLISFATVWRICIPQLCSLACLWSTPSSICPVHPLVLPIMAAVCRCHLRVLFFLCFSALVDM